MKLFYFYNDDFYPIVKLFLSSIRDNWEIYPVKTDNFNTNLHAGGLSGDKLRKYMIDYAIKNTQENEIFTICDTDIYFYKQLIPVVNDLFNRKQKVLINDNLIDKDIDILFQKEDRWNGCNMGVMSMRNNSRVIDFWKEVYDKSIPLKLWDQPIVNQFLYNNLISKTDESSHYADNSRVVWHTFDSNVWNWSLKLNHPFIHESLDIILHHANCVVSKEAKLKQMSIAYDSLLHLSQESHRAKYGFNHEYMSIYDSECVKEFLEHPKVKPNIVYVHNYSI